MIIDTHTHFYDPERPQGVPWPPPSEAWLYRRVLPEHYRALARPEGVSGTVVVEASGWLEDNQWVLDLAAADPFILGLVGHLEPGNPAFAGQLERFAANPLFCGIRVGFQPGMDQGAFLADMERLAAKGLELDVLMGFEHLGEVQRLAARLPQLRIVINHVGSVPIDGKEPDPRWVEAMQALACSPAVYCKVSGMAELSLVQPAPAALAYYTPVLDVLWAAFGPERLVYGSNWPVCERAAQYPQVQAVATAYFAAKGPQVLERFLWKNAVAAYRCRVPA
ncbi:MAG: amidohydrolase family protein [Candidatus Latescibacteria bacterium]|nr:amidohydrolase family protein [Candidatus Latescibacterota bacterium]